MKKKTKVATFLMVLIMAYLLLPLVVTIVYSLFRKWTYIVQEQFSLESYVTILQDKEFLLCIVRTLAACVIPIAITIVAANSVATNFLIFLITVILLFVFLH